MTPSLLQRLLIFLALLLTWNGPAFAGSRVALLIGNSAYRRLQPLRTPAADVALLRDALAKAGFDKIVTAFDLDQAGMQNALAAFKAEVRGSDIALLYFAGYGVRPFGTDCIAPVDADFTVKAESRKHPHCPVSQDALVDTLADAKTARLVLLEASREKPLSDYFGRLPSNAGVVDVSAGPPPNTVIFHATRLEEGFNDDAAVGAFTEALAGHLFQRGRDLAAALNDVVLAVRAKTPGAPEPEIDSNLGHDKIILVD